ncbi:MAG: alpha/beta fold hydrolase [Deltaproteobacteria bacterium]|nr:alpha/beta fold hydrolase [Deltaproteobacteria bacterium]
MPLARRFLMLVAGIYAVACAVLFGAQRTLLYPAPDPLAVRAPTGAELRTLDLGDATVPLMLTAGHPDVLFFHGNGGQLARSVPTSAAANAAGLAFAAVEYPGYGEATGAGPSESGIFAAARAALAEIGEPAPACVGHSLGSGVAVAMAAEGRCAAVVLASAYTSIPDMAARQYPYFPVRLLVLDRFDSRSRAPRVAVPALLIHGRRDTQIPPDYGEALAAAIPGATFELVDRAHNDIVDAAFWARVAGFLRP